MDGGSPFPKKETQICKLSCESMQEAMRPSLIPAAPPPPPPPALTSIKSTNTISRPAFIMSPATSNPSNSSLLPMVNTPTLEYYHQANPSSILIQNPNPNSIGRPNPNPRFNPTGISVSNSQTDYSAVNHGLIYEKSISSYRLKKAEQSASAAAASPYRYPSSIISSGLEERLISAATSNYNKSADELIKDEQQHDEHQLGLISSSYEGLLAAHAYSPWISEQSWADHQYQHITTSSICEEYSTPASAQPPISAHHPDRPLVASSSPPLSPPSHVVDNSSPSTSSASELHPTSAVDDPAVSTLTPVPPPPSTHETLADASQVAVPTDNKPPLKKQRRKGQKRVREARVALLTKSEVEHLEDGYRWRKYGQKAVKNSPHPRSYYRCTNSKCFVKKRVERCSEDPSLVVTTYEGQHTHHSPALLRGSTMQIDPNLPISSTNVTFVPNYWQTSLMNPSFQLSSSFAHGDHPLITRPSLSSPNILSSFSPMISTTLPFSSQYSFPIPALGYANAEMMRRMQPQGQGAPHEGHIEINSRPHASFTQQATFDAAQDQHERLTSSAVHARSPMPSATTPLVDKGLLHDMLPHTRMCNVSPPSSSS